MSGNTKTSANRLGYRTQVQDYGIFVSPTDDDTKMYIADSNPCINKINAFLECDASVGEQSVKKKTKHAKNTVRTCTRLVNYLFPGDDIGKFTWACVANADRISEFFIILKTKLKMRSRTIANYYPASILHKSIAGRYRPVRVADGPITARCRFM